MIKLIMDAIIRSLQIDYESKVALIKKTFSKNAMSDFIIEFFNNNTQGYRLKKQTKFI